MNAHQTDLLTNLRIIGRLRVNEQLYTNSKTFSASYPKWYTFLVRSLLWSNEKHETNMQAVADVLQRAYSAIEEELGKPAETRNTLYLRQLTDALASVFPGLNHLTTTYSDDSAVESLVKIHTISINCSLQKLAKHGFAPTVDVELGTNSADAHTSGSAEATAGSGGGGGGGSSSKLASTAPEFVPQQQQPLYPHRHPPPLPPPRSDLVASRPLPAPPPPHIAVSVAESALRDDVQHTPAAKTTPLTGKDTGHPSTNADPMER